MGVCHSKTAQKKKSSFEKNSTNKREEEINDLRINNIRADSKVKPSDTKVDNRSMTVISSDCDSENEFTVRRKKKINETNRRDAQSAKISDSRSISGSSSSLPSLSPSLEQEAILFNLKNINQHKNEYINKKQQNQTNDDDATKLNLFLNEKIDCIRQAKVAHRDPNFTCDFKAIVRDRLASEDFLNDLKKSFTINSVEQVIQQISWKRCQVFLFFFILIFVT
jgi:hypothetical protein